MCEKNICFFFQNKNKKVSLLQMLVKKAKENLNSSESDQQTSTASIQITRNKNPSTGFLSYAREITWLMFILLKLLPKSKIYNT